MLSLQIACINTKCPQISQDTTKNPSCGHLVFILFSQVLKKASAQPPTKRANRSSHCQFACSMVRPFHSFHSLRYFAALCSFVCACRSRASHRYTRLALRAMLASLTLTHSFISLFRSFMPACRSRASHRYTRLTLSCHARFACTHSLHRSTHSFRCFVCSLIPLISHPSLFTCFSHMPGSYVGYLHD